MYLTEQQLNFFHTFGFIHIPQLFTPDEVAWITKEFEHVLDTYGKGDVHDGSQRTMIVPTIDHSEKLCTLLDDPRVVGIASDILGDDFNYASGDGNYYSGDTGWHADGGYPELFAIKIAYYLDPLTRDTGCLRVMPGSHRPDSFWRTGNVAPRDSEELWGVHTLRGSGKCRLRNESRRSGNLLSRYPPRRLRRQHPSTYVHDESD